MNKELIVLLALKESYDHYMQYGCPIIPNRFKEVAEGIVEVEDDIHILRQDFSADEMDHHSLVSPVDRTELGLGMSTLIDLTCSCPEECPLHGGCTCKAAPLLVCPVHAKSII